MIRKPNFKLNWKYAFGEIALIFIGISLAIAFQNWNENRKAAAFEKEVLEEIETALAFDISELHLIGAAYSEADLMIDKVLNYAEHGGTQAQKDSIAYWLGKFLSFDRFNPSTSAYEVLKSEGLQHITNKGLRLLITEYYDEAIPNIVQALVDVEDDFELNVIELIKAEFEDFRFKEIALPADIDAFLGNRKNIVYLKVFRDNRNGTFDDIASGIDLNKKVREEIRDVID